MKAFPRTFVTRDEIYQMKDFSRGRVRVLARLDESKVDLHNARVHRTHHRRGAERPEAAGLRHRRHERSVRDAAHSGQHDGVLDPEQGRETGLHTGGFLVERVGRSAGEQSSLLTDTSV